MHAAIVTSSQTYSPQTSDRIRKVAKEFESIFTSMMLRAMRKTTGENPLLPMGFGEKIYTEMLDDEYAKMIGNHASLGLSDLIVKELERHENPGNSLEQLRNIGGMEPWMLDKAFIPQSGTGRETGSKSVTAQVSRWNVFINQASEKYGVDKALISAVIAQESAGNPYAVSRAGAKGLMQLMDTTAYDMGVTHPFSPWASIDGGVKYLRLMLNRFNGDEKLALASYNAGPAAVEKYNGIPPYRETMDYVKSVLEYKERFSKE